MVALEEGVFLACLTIWAIIIMAAIKVLILLLGVQI
jgi:hypothetical protein